MELLVGNELELYRNVGMVLEVGVGHGAHVGFRIAGLRHEEGVDRRLRMGGAREGEERR